MVGGLERGMRGDGKRERVVMIGVIEEGEKGGGMYRRKEKGGK